MTKRLRQVGAQSPELLPELWALVWERVAETFAGALLVASISHEAWSLLVPALRRRLDRETDPSNDWRHWRDWVLNVMGHHPRRASAWESLLRHKQDDSVAWLHMMRLLALAERQKRHAKSGRAYWNVGHQAMRAGVPLLKLNEAHPISAFYYVADGQARPLSTYEPLRIQCDTVLEKLSPFCALVAEAHRLAEAMDPVPRALALYRLAKGGRKRWGLMCDLLGVERMPTRPASEASFYSLATVIIGDTHYHSMLRNITLPFALHWYAREPEDPLAATLHFETASELVARVKKHAHALKTLADVEKPPKPERPRETRRLLQVQILGLG